VSVEGAGFPDRKHTEAGPSKVSGRRSGLDPGVLNRSRPSRATRPAGDSPHPRVGHPHRKKLGQRPDLNKCTLQAIWFRDPVIGADTAEVPRTWSTQHVVGTQMPPQAEVDFPPGA
jgi:hypothetical protein